MHAAYAPPGYEFGAGDNEVIGSTATWCTVLGIVVALELALSIVGDPGFLTVLVALVQVPLVVLLMLGGASLRRVVATQGNDVPNLLQAISSLGGLFLVRIILFCLWTAAMILMLVFALLLIAR